jgi:phosphatidylinositol glycan class B
LFKRLLLGRFTRHSTRYGADDCRLLIFAASTALDFAVTGRLLLPTLTFVHQNVLLNLSSFYGSTNPLYHLTQSLPIMLFPIWWWWAQGFVATLLPKRSLPSSLRTLDRPEGLRTLARALAFAITVLSLSPHSEWRFLHPFLPPLLLFTLPPLFRSFVPTILGAYRLARSIRQYTRIPAFPFYLILLSPLLPYLYLNALHGRAQVQVMDVLRRGDVGNVTGLVALMPCHSTPWTSALHKDVPAWFLTCEPPSG